jgi:Flp pilus assembly protein TadG
MLAKLKAFGKDTDGTSVIEFIVVFIGFVAVMTFVIELSIYMFFTQSIEKAAEAGVRAAIVSRPVHNQLATVNQPDQGERGDACSLNNSNCDDFRTRRCGRPGMNNCSTTRFNRILAHMQGYNAAIQRQNVTITYTYAGIGFAGGPTVPMVTVTVENMRFQTGILGLLLGNDANQMARLPKRSASMTGEDLGP